MDDKEYDQTEPVRPGHRQQVEELFQRLADVPESDRAACLADDSIPAEVATDVWELLAIHDRNPQTTLERPFADTQADILGALIGPYKLLEKIGEGGFGTVYMAEQQQPVVRKVALKLIKLGMDTRQVVARFEAERQALAMMDHPNIARVLDGGASSDGRPYFVMELVRGVPLNEYCDANHVTPRQRLEILVQVCHAVQHAHQKGVIHRDLKPSNILITLHDGRPVPKVIDFGIAKATSQRLTEKTLFTQHRQMIGTPQYMSPEQAEMSGLDIDTRSDIYSLGVILYELLTGSPPFSAKMLRSAGFGEIQRIIREVEPPRPSVRLSTLGREIEIVARNRSLEPKGLSRLLRGELDWIVMTALDKDRQRRYASASAMAADLERFLHGEPVSAVPPSSAYKLRKFISRNKGPVAAAILLALMLVTGVAISSYFAIRAQREAVRAKSAENRALANADEARRAEQLAEDRAAENARLMYAGLIRTTEKTIENGGMVIARDLLDRCPEPQRGWEWRWLERKVKDRARGIGNHRLRGVRDVAYSPDGELLASGGYDTNACLWDVKTGALIHRLEGHAEVVTGVAFSPDQQVLATCSADTTVRIWDVGKGQLIRTLTGHTSWLAGVDFSPDGKLLASCGGNSNLRLWNMETLTLHSALDGYSHDVWGIDFSPDGSRLATSTGDGQVVVWSIPEQRRLMEGQISDFGCWTVRYSPSGEELVTAGFDNMATVWDARTLRKKFDLGGYNVPVRAAEFTPDGRAIVVAGFGALRAFDAVTGERLGEMLSPQAEMHAVTIHPSGNRLVSGGGSKDVLEWPVAPIGGPLELIGHRGQVYDAVLSPDGRSVYSVGGDGSLRAWSAMTAASQWQRYPLPAERRDPDPRCVAIDPASNYLVLAGKGGNVCAVDAGTGHNIWCKPSDPRVEDIAVSPAGGLAVTGAAPDGEPVRLALRRIEDGAEIRVFDGHEGDIRRIAFDATGRRFVSSSADDTLIVWDVETGTALHRLRSPADGRPFAVCVYRNELFAGMANGAVTVWNLDDGSMNRRFFAHNSVINAIDMASDGSRLLTGAWHNPQVRVWNPSTDEFMLELNTQCKRLSVARFSHDDAGILAAGEDGRLRMWELDAPEGAYPARRAAARTNAEQLQRDIQLAEQVAKVREGIARLRVPGLTDKALATVRSQLMEHERLCERNHPLCHQLKREEEWTKQMHEALESPVTIPDAEMQSLVGSYGDRDIFIRDGRLHYKHRFYKVEHELLPLDADTWHSMTVDGFRLRFDEYCDDKPCVVHGVYLSGNVDQSRRESCRDDN